jgi:hypothetical protein
LNDPRIGGDSTLTLMSHLLGMNLIRS